MGHHPNGGILGVLHLPLLVKGSEYSGGRGVRLSGGCPSAAGHVMSMYHNNHPLILLLSLLFTYSE